jgi:D-alanyl-D-alanine carboxypeptidase
MKKKNRLLIAASLLMIHILLFILFFRPTPAGKAIKPTSLPKHPTSLQRPDPTPSSVTGLDFSAVNLNIPPFNNTAAETVNQPEEPTTSKTSPSAKKSPYARPRNEPTYIRNDLPNRKTSKVFSQLTGTPYNGAIIIDAHTGKILFQDRATEYCYPASITKLMTMLIVLEHVKAGKTDLNAIIKIPKEACAIGGSQVFLDPRESFSVDNLLNALMIHSANDAAAALAIHIAGSIDAFVKLMNQKAAQLGMNATIYHTPHGLPPGKGRQPDISTPYDIALLSLEALRHEETLKYTSTRLEYLPLTPLRKEKQMLVNRNELVNQKDRTKGYPGCDGLKTGFHNAGGSSLTATAVRGGQRIIVVLLGSPNKNIRNDTAKKLLNKGFQTWGIPNAP